MEPRMHIPDNQLRYLLDMTNLYVPSLEHTLAYPQSLNSMHAIILSN